MAKTGLRNGFVKTCLVTGLSFLMIGCQAKADLDPPVTKNEPVAPAPIKVSEPAASPSIDSPYFLHTPQCKLPKLSAELEAIQSQVMKRLQDGLPQSSLDQDVISAGTNIVFRCGTAPSLSADPLRLHLIHRNIEAVSTQGAEGEFCEGGQAYSAIASNLSALQYHDLGPQIQCAALKQASVGTYGLNICVKDGQVESLELADVKAPHFRYGLMGGKKPVTGEFDCQ